MPLSIIFTVSLLGKRKMLTRICAKNVLHVRYVIIALPSRAFRRNHSGGAPTNMFLKTSTTSAKAKPQGAKHIVENDDVFKTL
jgi:hypothetical protein